MRERPADICFYLRGGGVLVGFHSNVVTVPKTAIQSALERREDELLK